MRRRGTGLAAALTACAGIAAVAAAVAGLGGSRAPAVAAAAAPARPAQSRAPRVPAHRLRVPMCTRGSVVRVGGPRIAYAVTVRSLAVAYLRPGRGRIARFGRLNQNGVPTVFGVLAARLDAGCRASWYRVQLPLRPNGITGWVRAAAVSERAVRARIVVDLRRRTVTLYRSGHPVLSATAAIGSAATPTPTGRYYVNQKLRAADPLGPYGPAAIGVSAFSPVLTGWAQGGPIAIHGTNEAGLIGGAVSHGCLRVRNDEILRLWKLVPTGTPVLIRM